MCDCGIPEYPPPSDMTDYFTSVGRVAMAWAFMEMHVNLTIWELANVEQYIGACITAQFIAPAPRFSALIALFEQRGASEARLTELNQMQAKARGLAALRNRWVHDPAFSKEGQFHRFEITADRKLKFDLPNPVELSEMQALEKKISDLTLEFRYLVRDILAELPAFPRRQFQLSAGIDPIPLPARNSDQPAPVRQPDASPQ